MHINKLNNIVDANGISVCYDDMGDGNVPLLFIHGFPFDKSMWQPQMDYFKLSQRVIAYDIRGFGKSSGGNEEVSIGLYADDLIKFLDTLKIEKVIACGLSMGGYILLNAVNRFPERFKSIILSDTQCIGDSPEAKEKRSKTIELIKSGGLKEFAEGFVKNIFCGESLSNKTDLVNSINNTILATSPSTICGTLKALAERMDMCSSLSKISVPSLIVCGKEDKVTPVVQSEFLHQNIRGSVFFTIGQAGHMSSLEQAGEFNKHVLDFISKTMN